VSATGLTTTTFQPSASLPVSSTAPVGTRYYWRVRACNAAGCGGWSPVRYVNVGRLRDDLNGDGYADIAVGAPYKDLSGPDQGRVYVYLGGNPINPGVDYMIDGPKTSGVQFGSKVAFVGDLNGDGYADLAVGSLGGSGTVYVFFGPSLPSTAGGANAILPGEFDGDQYGAGAISGAGDMNGDGFADMVIGAPLYSGMFFVEQGRAYLVLGGTQIGSTGNAVISGAASSDTFGASISAGGDQNGDGIPDVVVGAPGVNGGTGRAYVFYGPSLPANAAQGLAIDPSGQNYGGFGRAVASDGDIDGDRADDVLIGAPGARLAYLLLGRPGGMDTFPDVTIGSMGTQTVEFGNAVCFGDVTADGLADYIVADDRDSGLGRFNTYFGPSLSGVPDFVIAGRNGNVIYGNAIAVGDVNGNGFGDFLIADPGLSSSTGRVYVYFGGSPPNTGIDVTLDGESIGDSFGSSVH
jgi:hypothetical protein